MSNQPMLPPSPKHYHVRPGGTWNIFLAIKAKLEKRNPDTVINEAYVIRFALRFTDAWLDKVEPAKEPHANP